MTAVGLSQRITGQFSMNALRPGWPFVGMMARSVSGCPRRCLRRLSSVPLKRTSPRTSECDLTGNGDFAGVIRSPKLRAYYVRADPKPKDWCPHKKRGALSLSALLREEAGSRPQLC